MVFLDFLKKFFKSLNFAQKRGSQDTPQSFRRGILLFRMTDNLLNCRDGALSSRRLLFSA
jgi:hypothetical protein